MIAPPLDFNPWAALLELRADLLLADRRRWVCVADGRNYASQRTNGGLGLIWADIEGCEAVWLAWLGTRGGGSYPRGQVSPAWSKRAQLQASLVARGEGWRAFTWAFGSTGLREPDELLEGTDPEALVWELLARRSRETA